MFSSFSGNLSGMTGWIQENSKKAADSIQKSVTDISQGVSDMMVETPQDPTASEKPDQTEEGSGETVEQPTEAKDQQNPGQPQSEEQAVNKNEVLTQVTAKFSSDVSKVWGTALSFTKNVVEKVGDSEIVKQASVKVIDVANTGAKLIEQAPLVSDFNKEQEKFISSNKRGGPIQPPWVGYKDEEQLKEQIFCLSKDKRNFLRAPPAGAQFEFDYQKSQPHALALLEADSNLTEMRFQLVPKVTKEVDFWRNYFYRISLIKQSAEPVETTVEIIQDEEDLVTSSETAEEIKNLEEEFASEEVGTKSDEIPQWEKELQDELQEYEVVEGEEGSNGEWEKELEDMLGEGPEEGTGTEPEIIEEPSSKDKNKNENNK